MILQNAVTMEAGVAHCASKSNHRSHDPRPLLKTLLGKGVLVLFHYISKMFGMRKFNTPFLRPAAPFIVGGLTVFFLVAKMQTAMINSKQTPLFK